jgi:hypothetical protein
MPHAYQSDLDECKTWKVQLLNYANSLQDLIRAVKGKSVEELGDEVVKAVKEITDFDKKTNSDYDEEKREALKELREVNVFADKLLSVINEAREKGWYRIELGYLKVNKEGLVGDGRIINTRDMVFKTGERIWHIIAPAKEW